MKKTTYFIAGAFLLGLWLPAFAQKKNEVKVPLKAENWEFAEGKVEFSGDKANPTMTILPGAGFVVLKAMDFTNGTIEFDMQTIDPRFASFYFRWQSPLENECFYLRTGRIGSPLANDAVQYAPFVDGVNLWDVMEHYQTNADLKKDAPNHIRLVVNGSQMRMYVNSVEKPTLDVPILEGNVTMGTLAFDSQSIISNLVVKHGETADLSPLAGVDPTDKDPNYLRKWMVSATVDAPKPMEFSGDYFLKEDASWEPIEAERRGLVNLTRKFGNSENRRVVWLKTTIVSDKEQVRKLSLGFSDEVWVLINGRMLYVDKNLYGHPIMKYPDGRCSIGNASFDLPLAEGKNEVMIAVANDFYGWAIMARLDQLNGITFE